MATALGEFLRVRRAQAPTVGSDPRRTPGMRREEVAVAAAVSADYYTRLEQGRETNPSDGVLAALATALAMTDDDLRHAIRLRDRRRPERGPGPVAASLAARASR